jgi:hypothetical protein
MLVVMQGKEVGLMKRLIMLSTLAATMAVSLALAGSASAAKPEVRTFHDEGTASIADCGRFEVLTDYVLDIRWIVFFDDEGNEDFAREHFVFQDFFYNSETDEGFAERNTGNAVIDLPSEDQTSLSGLSYHVTVPGEGVVLLQAGRQEFDEAGNVVFVAGPHQVLDEDFDKLCEALA